MSSQRQGCGAPCTHSRERPSRGPGQRRAPSGTQSQGSGQRDPGSSRGCSGDSFSTRIASACISLSAGARRPMARQPECELPGWASILDHPGVGAARPLCPPLGLPSPNPPAPTRSRPPLSPSLLSLTWDGGQLPPSLFACDPSSTLRLQMNSRFESRVACGQGIAVRSRGSELRPARQGCEAVGSPALLNPGLVLQRIRWSLAVHIHSRTAEVRAELCLTQLLLCSSILNSKLSLPSPLAQRPSLLLVTVTVFLSIAVCPLSPPLHCEAFESKIQFGFTLCSFCS